MRDTIAPTVLAAGFKTNVLPQIATAEIDCRLLPGENQKQFLANIKKLINDKDVKVEVLLQSPSATLAFEVGADDGDRRARAQRGPGAR